jgi:hypothetical protein
MSNDLELSAETENSYHRYRGSEIPFYVRLLWVGFYSLAIYYVIRYMFPAIQQEFRVKHPRPAASAPAETPPAKTAGEASN